MKIIDTPIPLVSLQQMAKSRFGNLVKAVVDVKKRIMALDEELHADEEALLLSKGSKQEDLWGINLYPDLRGEAMIEFDSMINVRPSQDNRSRGVDSPDIRARIASIVNQLITL